MIFLKHQPLNLIFVLFCEKNYQNLVKAILHFKEEVIKDNYIFIEIPSEDIFVIQAFK